MRTRRWINTTTLPHPALKKEREHKKKGASHIKRDALFFCALELILYQLYLMLPCGAAQAYDVITGSQICRKLQRFALRT